MRTLLPLLSLVFVLAATPTGAGDAAAAAWLFVLTGTVQSANETKLTIIADPTVIAFTDRPEREVRTIALETFIATVWNAGPDSFAEDPPNAAVVVGDNRIAIDELKSITRDGQTVSFQTSTLAGPLPEAGSNLALTIDLSCPRGPFC